MNKRHRLKKTKLNTTPAGRPHVSSALQEELLRFMEYHPPRRLNRNLRKMLLDHLLHESTLEDFYLKDLLYDLQGIFELCDAIEMEET